jgi:hypothetical protein
MGISEVRGSTYTPPPAPKTQRADTQRALELQQENRLKEVARRPPSTDVVAAEQRRDAAPQKEKGSRVDVRA